MPNTQMIINYVPGEECRVAVVEDGKLEELHTERFASASRVGNIYLGKVSNVEASIQAAFIDFGVEENGFLHISDLHPRYFPGEDVEETTERVGHKTPRRERPPIQHCLRRGQEVVVQVLKEGVGTKGPSLTSYLSIPGRFLVMMPQMDRVGVSRKVEDEDARLKMREILDQLELPEGFGFILRTAGMDRTKTELKRDLAYLQRLWKDMDRRLQSGTKSRLLYSESDLLVRCLRDVLTGDTDEIIIDNEMAIKRANRFLKIVAPRTQTKLLQFPGATPIFHAFGIEQQIALINAREVPLPSGGRLVIDQTEALVAIDVNSGKSRDARDAEDNAYRTNVEAVDEICRQLRLRDLGGIVINDLIDMRHASHRKDIETRFRERLKRDRARSTVTGISEFGILEMTRQRMRGSHEQVHFHDCPTCRGRGLVQRPESVAADALRELAAVLDVDRVYKVEVAVPPRVAGELLSTKRQLLSRIERHSGKKIEVRVSETLPADRVTFYAYDAQGADIDLTNLPKPRRPRELKVWEEPDAPKTAAEAGWSMSDEELQTPPEPEVAIEDLDDEPHPIEIDDPRDEPLAGEEDTDGPAGAGGAPGSAADGERRGRRRRRGRGRGRGGDVRDGGAPVQAAGPRERSRGGSPPRGDGRGPAARPPQPAPIATGPMDAEHGPLAGDAGHAGEQGGMMGDQGSQVGPDGEPRRRRRRRRRGRGRGAGGPDGGHPGMDGHAPAGGEHSEGLDGAGNEFADGDGHAAEGRAMPEARGGGGYGNQRRPSSQVQAQSGSDDGPGPGNEADGAAHGGEHLDGPGDESFGPDGQPGGAPPGGEGGEQGEGGPRRRRRRRRGRGRGGAGGGAMGGPGGMGGEAGGHQGQPAGPAVSGAAPGGPMPPRDSRGGGGGGGERREGPSVPRDGRGDRGGPRRDGRDGGGGGGGGRGGRGDGRGRDGRGGGRGGSGGGGGGDRSGGGSAAPRERPASPPPASPAAPQPKLLYSFRRKLSASELNRRPKPE